MLVRLRDIQSIESAEYDLGQKGVVLIKGHNSNGKSILIKSLDAIASLAITDSDTRQTLIRDTRPYGVIEIENEGTTLTCVLHRERNSCSLKLKRVDGTEIVRTFRDGGLKELVNEFGFACYAKNSVCLQIYSTFGPMPFVNTSPITNGEIVQAVTEDDIAKQFIENYKSITYKKAKEALKNLDSKLDSLNVTKNSLQLFDVEEYKKFLNQMCSSLKIVKSLSVVSVNKCRLVPDVQFVNITAPKLQRVRVFRSERFIDIESPSLGRFRGITIVPSMVRLRKLDEMLEDIEAVYLGHCPTCGRLFIER